MAAYVALAAGAPPGFSPSFRVDARVSIPGYSSPRQIDTLATIEPGDEVMVEVQRRVRPMGHQFLDSVEGKLAFTHLSRAHVVSSAGFTRDAVERIRRSNGRITASSIRMPADEWPILPTASLAVTFADGSTNRIDLNGSTFEDPVSGDIRCLMLEGVDPGHRMLVYVVISAGGRSSALDVRSWLMPPPTGTPTLSFEWTELDGTVVAATPVWSGDHSARVG